jgi:flagellar basal body P-ring protein FlgI
MRRWLLILSIWLYSVSYAEPLINLVTVEDGLEVDNVENISDDYIRLTLLNPSYQQATAIQLSIEQWLGPNMVTVDSSANIKVQAPRDSSQRVRFISALLNLDIAP